MLRCLYLDIDYLKDVNDTLGHADGDSVLKQFGERLQACVRVDDMVAPLAGEQFVIVLEGLGQASWAQAAAEKIIAAMRDPLVVFAIFFSYLSHTDVQAGAESVRSVRWKGEPACRGTSIQCGIE